MQQQPAAPADEHISWWARGDIGSGVQQGSLRDSELCTTLAGHSELGAAALLKAIWWDLRLASLLMHLLSHHTVVWGILSLLCVIFFFVCFFVSLYGYGFLSGGKS